MDFFRVKTFNHELLSQNKKKSIYKKNEEVNLFKYIIKKQYYKKLR